MRNLTAQLWHLFLQQTKASIYKVKFCLLSITCISYSPLQHLWKRLITGFFV